MRERLPNIWAIATEYDIRKIVCGDLAMIRWERRIEIGMCLHIPRQPRVCSVYFSVLFTVARIFYIPVKDTNSTAVYLLEDNLFSTNTHDIPVVCCWIHMKILPK